MAYCGPRGVPLHEFIGWPESSQQAALAWQTRESQRCPACGAHPDDEIHWHAVVCRSCQARQSAEADIQDEKTRGVRIEAARGPVTQCPECSA